MLFKQTEPLLCVAQLLTFVFAGSLKKIAPYNTLRWRFGQDPHLPLGNPFGETIMKTQEESDLVAAVAKLQQSAPVSVPVRASKSLICRVTVLNNTHPGDNVIIVAGGVRYFSRGGKDETVGPYTLNLGGQKSYTFNSINANGCVTRYFCALTCTIDGDPQNVTFDWPAEDPHPPNLEPNKCLLQSGFAVGVSAAVVPGDPLVLEVFSTSGSVGN